MKPQHLQAREAVAEFRQIATSLSNPSAFKSGKEYRRALDKRTASISRLYNEGIINEKLYQQLCLADDFAWIPEALK